MKTENVATGETIFEKFTENFWTILDKFSNNFQTIFGQIFAYVYISR
jgi:hypothetical protein